uniref:arginine/serine-rich coiled-coil protein 2-like isoform X1 n=1 Tax=Styela clava TaxID=7725 RepID=UPI001939B221|nr:arginine/serine-rich coiled-coil protein 2-like isoform X1 [Styela clava]
MENQGVPSDSAPDDKLRNNSNTSDSSSSSSDKARSPTPQKKQHSPKNEDRRNKSRNHIRRRRSRSNSESSEDEHHRKHSHRHRESSKKSHHHRHRHSSRERRRKHRSRSPRRRQHNSYGKRSPRNSGDEESESRRRRSRSRDGSRSNRRSSRERRHRSSRHRRSRSPKHSRRNGLHSKVEADKMKDASGKSASTHRKNSWSRSPSPPTGYDRAMDAQERLARRLERARELMRRKNELSKKENTDAKNMSGLSALDKVQEAVKRASQIVSGDSTVNTSQEGISAVASAQIEALKAKALAETGIEVPSYYNPLAVNPMSYAHQAMKRKMLWSKKDDNEKDKEKQTSTIPGKTALWSSVKFGDDKSNEKFAKLMGIKGDQGNGSEDAEANAIIKKQAEVFQNLDMQYQQARITTHTQRGLGLGFSTSMINPNTSTQQPTSTT